MKKYKYSHMSVLKSISRYWNLHNSHRSMRWIEGLETWRGKHTQFLAFGQNTPTKHWGRGQYVGPTRYFFSGASKGKIWLFPSKGHKEGLRTHPFCPVSTWIKTEKTATFLTATAFLTPAHRHLTPSSTACSLKDVVLGFKHSKSDHGHYCTEALVILLFFCITPPANPQFWSFSTQDTEENLLQLHWKTKTRKSQMRRALQLKQNIFSSCSISSFEIFYALELHKIWRRK